MDELRAVSAIREAMDVLDRWFDEGLMRIDIDRDNGSEDVVIIQKSFFDYLLDIREAYLDSLTTDEEKEREKEEIIALMQKLENGVVH